MSTDMYSPIKLGEITVRNRIVLAPMGTRSNLMDGTISERCSLYLEERAKGGAGLIIPELTAVKEGYTWIPSMQIYSDRLIPSLSRLAASVHAYDSRIVMQVALHGGRAASKVTGKRCIAPSAIASPLYKEIPEALTVPEIYELVEDWRTAAIRAQRASFDGVEVHGCHGYLINEFISPATNKRTDEFGGSLENRLRFAKLIIEAIRESCGRKFIIGFKMAAYEELEGGVKIEDAAAIAKAIESYGVDYIHVSSTSSTIPGHEFTKYPSVPCMYDGKNCLAPLADVVKKAVSVPVILASAVVEPEDANDLIRTGVTDMVAVGRGFLADAHWGSKLQEGGNVRPCIGCMLCHKHTLAGTDLVCAVNGGLLREFYDNGLGKTDHPQKVMIVGGGPGGMEAAIRAHDRGHTVTIFERSDCLGGALRAASAPDFKARVKRLLDYYEKEISDRSIDVRFNLEITPEKADELIKSESYDAVVLAVGGIPARPPISGIDGSNVFIAEQVMVHPADFAVGNTVNIIGAGKVGMEAAWMLSEMGKTVRIFEMIPRDKIMADDHPTTRSALFHRMDEHNIEVYGGAQVTAIHGDGIDVRINGEQIHFDGDSVLLASGYKRNESLFEHLQRTGPAGKVFEIGDAKEARGLVGAIHDGYYVGMYRI